MSANVEDSKRLSTREKPVHVKIHLGADFHLGRFAPSRTCVSSLQTSVGLKCVRRSTSKRYEGRDAFACVLRGDLAASSQGIWACSCFICLPYFDPPLSHVSLQGACWSCMAWTCASPTRTPSCTSGSCLSFSAAPCTTRLRTPPSPCAAGR